MGAFLDAARERAERKREVATWQTSVLDEIRQQVTADAALLQSFGVTANSKDGKPIVTLARRSNARGGKIQLSMTADQSRVVMASDQGGVNKAFGPGTATDAIVKEFCATAARIFEMDN